MRRHDGGQYVELSAGGGGGRAFVPRPLPPDPPLRLDSGLTALFERAHLALGRLDGQAHVLPDPHTFLYSYVRKEAVLSSQIEGTQSSLSDLLLFELSEAPGVPLDDVHEVSTYVAALEHGIARVRQGEPISNRLIRDMHAILLSSGRGAGKAPGEFRRTQNWIGGATPASARFVPPPADRVQDAMASLERFMNDVPERTPTLLKAALAHVQFETIHPFLDGNGRLGRLLVSLLLVREGLLRAPVLYTSLYLKQHRPRYYELLDNVRLHGEWEEWVEFFITGIEETARGATDTAERLLGLGEHHRGLIQRTGRIANSALRVHAALMQRPLRSVNSLVADTGLSFPAVNNSLAALLELGFVREVSGRQRHRLFVYTDYLAILQAGTEGVGEPSPLLQASSQAPPTRGPIASPGAPEGPPPWSPLWGAHGDAGSVPDRPGYYAIFVDAPESLPAHFSDVLRARGTRLIYIGIAEKRTLRRRLVNDDLRGQGHSTFFRSLGAVLGKRPLPRSLHGKKNQINFKFSKPDRDLIVDWAKGHLSASWFESDPAQRGVETRFIETMTPLFNLKGNPQPDAELERLRAECLRIARGEED